jgi:hypothetical protein
MAVNSEQWTTSSACDSNSCVGVMWHTSSAGCDSGTDLACVEVGWRKSSASANNGQCVEVGVWKKSSASGPWTDNCVEVSGAPGEILVRDSKDPDGPVLRFDYGEWNAFLEGVRLGEFDIKVASSHA